MENNDLNKKSISEALEKAHECWLIFFQETKRVRNNTLFLCRQNQSLVDQIISSVGSTINLFPNTHFEPDDFRCWQSSVDDAWSDDWFNVGADLYEAMSKVELTNVDSTEYKPTSACTTES